MSKAWCKHTPENPCAYCQDKHDEHEWIVTFAEHAHERWLERKRLVAALRDIMKQQDQDESYEIAKAALEGMP